jgi:hypothetical protein
MIKAKLALLISLFCVSCGSLRVTPKGCKTNATYSSNPDVLREVTYDILEDRKNEITMTKNINVINDTEVKIKDILKENGLRCEDVKKLRVRIKTAWFFSREVELKVLKN